MNTNYLFNNFMKIQFFSDIVAGTEVMFTFEYPNGHQREEAWCSHYCLYGSLLLQRPDLQIESIRPSDVFIIVISRIFMLPELGKFMFDTEMTIYSLRNLLYHARNTPGTNCWLYWKCKIIYSDDRFLSVTEFISWLPTVYIYIYIYDIHLIMSSVGSCMNKAR